jgi:hypothetical protein
MPLLAPVTSALRGVPVTGSNLASSPRAGLIPRRATYAVLVPQPEQVSITDARLSASEDLDRRQRRYLWTMLVRVICFGLMIVVPGWWRLVALFGAVFLPAAAVLLANNVDRRAPATRPIEDETVRPALPSGDVIPGEVAEPDEFERPSA